MEESGLHAEVWILVPDLCVVAAYVECLCFMLFTCNMSAVQDRPGVTEAICHHTRGISRDRGVTWWCFVILGWCTFQCESNDMVEQISHWKCIIDPVLNLSFYFIAISSSQEARSSRSSLLLSYYNHRKLPCESLTTMIFKSFFLSTLRYSLSLSLNLGSGSLQNCKNGWGKAIKVRMCL